MADKQIVIKDYFNILRDGYGRIYCIQEIGDPKSLIKAIREQNEYIQAKEQECEELKEDKELWKSNFEGMVGAIEELSHQLDQLKVKIEQEKALKETYLTCYKAKHEDIEGVLFKLKQTLTEIKAICNNNDELQGDFNVVDCDKYKLGKHNLANKILQKISECGVK